MDGRVKPGHDDREECTAGATNLPSCPAPEPGIHLSWAPPKKKNPAEAGFPSERSRLNS